MAVASVARFLMLLLIPACASGKDLSKYPCTVFSSEACFRLPVGTHVDYSVPADYSLYTVSKGSQPLATIYVGNAPQAVDGELLAAERKTKQGTIKVYRSRVAESEALDILISPVAKDSSTIHISANVNPTTRFELSELLSSIRPCTSIRSGGQKCPANSAWSDVLTKALSPE